MKKSLFIPLLCGLSFVYTACDEYDDTYPKEYHKDLVFEANRRRK